MFSTLSFNILKVLLSLNASNLLSYFKLSSIYTCPKNSDYNFFFVIKWFRMPMHYAEYSRKHHRLPHRRFHRSMQLTPQIWLKCQVINSPQAWTCTPREDVMTSIAPPTRYQLRDAQTITSVEAMHHLLRRSIVIIWVMANGCSI